MATFTRMDESTAEQWATIGEETVRNQPRVAEGILAMLESLAGITDGFAVDQLTHALQTAAMAEAEGNSDEMVVAALCHDIGKAVSVPNHPEIAAAILRPYVSEEIHWTVLVHQDFQTRHYNHYFDGDRNLRDRHRDHPSFELAQHFADVWDQAAFDPDRETPPLAHFEERVRGVFAAPRY